MSYEDMFKNMQKAAPDGKTVVLARVPAHRVKLDTGTVLSNSESASDDTVEVIRRVHPKTQTCPLARDTEPEPSTATETASKAADVSSFKTPPKTMTNDDGGNISTETPIVGGKISSAVMPGPQIMSSSQAPMPQPMNLMPSCIPFRGFNPLTRAYPSPQIVKQSAPFFGSFNAMIDPLTQKRYIENDEGLFANLKEGKPPVRICNFWFRVSRIVDCYDASGMVGRELTIEVHPNGGTCIIHIDDKDFKKLFKRILDERHECAVDPSFAAKASSFFGEYAANKYKCSFNEVCIERRYISHGWVNVDGGMRYMSGADADCTSDVVIPRTNGDIKKTIWNNGIQLLHLAATPQGMKLIVPLFLYLHYGYAAKLFEDAGEPARFLALIIGESGSFKTALCELLVMPFISQQQMNFESTNRAIELLRGLCWDMNLWLDDIFSDDKETIGKYEKVLRAFGDSVGRAKSDNSAKSISRIDVRGGCVVTAEHEFSQQQSSKLRALELKICRGDIRDDILSKLQATVAEAKQAQSATIIQLYFAGWIRFLELNYWDIVEYIKKFKSDHYPKLKFKRLMMEQRALCIIAHLVTRWGKAMGCITHNEGAEINRKFEAIVFEVMRENQVAASSLEPWQLFLSELCKSIGEGDAVIAQEKYDFENLFIPNAKVIGYFRRKGGMSEMVLAPDKAFVLVKTRCTKLGKTLNIDARTLWRKLYDQGLTQGYEEQHDGRVYHRNGLKIKIHGVQTKMQVFNYEKFEQVTGRLL